MSKIYAVILVLALGLFSPLVYAEDAAEVVTPDAVAEVVVELEDVDSDLVVEPEDSEAPSEPAEGESGVPPVDGELDTDEEALGLLGDLLSAVLSGEWVLAFALLIMLLVFALRRFGVLSKVSGRALPFVSAGVGLGIGFAAAVVAGATLLPALLAGVASGLAASGLWDLLAG